MTTQYQTGDYVRIHDHDGAEITVKITDSGIPNRQGDFAFKAGARMFKNSEILGLGEVPVVSEKKFEVGDKVKIAGGRLGKIKRIEGDAYRYFIDLDIGAWGWFSEDDISPYPANPAPDTEVHANLVAENEAVKHPAHYGGADDPYEAIKVIEAWGLNFNLGSVLKYVRRAGKKDASKELEDLHKARFYIDHEISRVEQAK